MRIRRNLFLALLFVLLCAALASCGNDTDEIVYTHEFRYITDFPNENESGKFEVVIERTMSFDKQLCVMVRGEQKDLETSEDGEFSVEYPPNFILKANPSDGTLTKTELADLDEEEADILRLSSGIWLNEMVGLPDGGYICCGMLPMMVSVDTQHPEKADYGRRIIRYSADGKIQKYVRVVDIDSDFNLSMQDNGNSALFAYSDGLLYILTVEGTVYVFDENISLVSKLNLPDEQRASVAEQRVDYKTFLTTDKDGKLILGCCITRNGQKRFACYPLSENGLGEPLELPDTGDRTPIFANGYDVYYSDSVGLFGQNLNDKEPTRLFGWVDVDLVSSDVVFMKIENPEKIYVITRDNKAGVIIGGNQAKSGKQLIRVAYEEAESMSYSINLSEKAREFNLFSDEYRVELCAYNTDDVSTANEKLRRDMVSGKMPDIILFAATITPEEFVKFDALANLYEFMDKDDKFTRDAFVPCVLKPVETSSGKLPYLVVGYSFEGFMGKTSVLEQKNSWTIDEFYEFASTIEDGKYLTYTKKDNKKEALFNSLLPAVLGGFIDYDNRKCNFDESFAKLLETCAIAPVLKLSGNPDVSFFGPEKILLQTHYINGLTSSIGDRKLAFGSSGVTYIGYPQKESGREGVVLTSYMSFGISERSKKRKEAWDFICWYLDDMRNEYNAMREDLAEASIVRFPPTWEAVDEVLYIVSKIENFYIPITKQTVEGKITTGYKFGTLYYDETDKRSRDSYNAQYLQAVKDGGIVVKATDEDISELRRLMENVTVVRSTDTATMGIIKEEASAYFAGAQTLERTVEIITDRVQTRLSE